LKFKSLLIAILLIILSQFSYAQQNQVLGTPELSNLREGLYDFSDPSTLNIKVSVWGYVARPGKYIIPQYATVTDLLSYAGGPERDAELSDLRIYRVDSDGKEQLIRFSYNDLVWSDHLEVRNRVVPTLKAGDIFIVPGSPKMFFEDWFRLGIEIFSALLSIVNIILIIQYRY
jgi:SLBB domain